jgi:signal transduction histidine kinase
MITVQIADTGCGIPEQDLPYVFDRFYRVERQQRSDRAGLGLAITKSILELHGCTIEAHSTLNAGTTIRFQLPACTS